MTTSYVPGECNIGSAEIQLRRRSGYIGLAATVLLLVLFVLFDVSAWWRLIVIAPAFASAIGFLQAGLHFCAGFGMRGVFNFGDDVTKHESIESAEHRRVDRRKALAILGYSLLISLGVMIIALLLP